MIDFLKRYWLFIIINAAVLLIAAMFFMVVINTPQDGAAVYQIN